MRAKLTRFEFNNVQTLGKLEVFDNDVKVFECATLELEVDKNQVRDDAIPYGMYEVVKYSSRKYPKAFHILNVPNRTKILIHNGNYYNQILGCVLVGREHIDINNDGLKDVTSSKVTLKELYNLMPKSFRLDIIKDFKTLEG